MIIPNDATIAVVDGTKLRLFRNKAAEPNIKLVEESEPKVDAHNQGSGLRHQNSSANPDADRAEEDSFAAAAAEALNRRVLDGEIDSLVVIADARTLGEMRRHFHKTLEAKLVGDLTKNLTNSSIKDIEAVLDKA
jgi:protein required for attachment to host cells